MRLATLLKLSKTVRVLPHQAALTAVRKLIESGVSLGKIQPNYSLVGHRQLRDTECPGDRLYETITTWDHYDPHPT
ncbi:unnamed protein product [Darwinula stevensoni]|uniref:Peptidoglycan recognition protein family domain-containing protein n=1 Tax=Darwinula stevensoni TaxID=69355 RepID=A0A7R8XJV0_9CRUS|nr:unnamed protein product [Darwinula stevensoni]CAG0895686.1 unnamed protein product [Darwinula stevensoni]